MARQPPGWGRGPGWQVCDSLVGLTVVGREGVAVPQLLHTGREARRCWECRAAVGGWVGSML